jgi:hypothetical protein
LVSTNGYLRLFNQAYHMANGKERENRTRDPQSQGL